MATDFMRGDPDALIQQAPDMTPEEQQQLQQVLRNVETMLLDEQAYPRMLETISKAADKTDAVAVAITTLGEQVVQLAQKAGVQLSTDVLMAVALYLIGVVTDHAVNAGAMPEPDEEQMGDILARVLDLWFRNRPEDFDAEDSMRTMQVLPEGLKQLSARAAANALVPSENPDVEGVGTAPPQQPKGLLSNPPPSTRARGRAMRKRKRRRS